MHNSLDSQLTPVLMCPSQLLHVTPCYSMDLITEHCRHHILPPISSDWVIIVPQVSTVGCGIADIVDVARLRAQVDEGSDNIYIRANGASQWIPVALVVRLQYLSECRVRKHVPLRGHTQLRAPRHGHTFML